MLDVGIAIAFALSVFAGVVTWLTTPAPWRQVAERVTFLPKVK
jgi:hypothetical protein